MALASISGSRPKQGSGWNPSLRVLHPVLPPLSCVFVNILASFGPEKVSKCVIYFSTNDNCYKINKSLEKWKKKVACLSKGKFPRNFK
jgi:hypothetical protein